MKPVRCAILYSAFLALLGLSIFQALHSVVAQVNHPVEIKIDPKVFDAYVGQYQDNEDADAIVSVFREADKFYVQPSEQDKVEIVPVGETKFFTKSFKTQIDFVCGGDGKVSSLVLHSEGNEHHSKKTSDLPAKDTRVPFTRMEAMVPMRDGVRLHTIILMPQNQTTPLPIIYVRTPYGVDGWNSDRVNAAHKELVADGYIFAFQDIRGRFGSEGQFVMMRPPRDRRDAKTIDESTDAYDTIDWFLKKLPRNNGRVGIMGVSYPGWLSTMSLLDPHPALKAVSPQAPMTDVWMGDDFFHNGAFRQSYGYEYVKSMETSKTFEDVSFGKTDAYDWYLSLKMLANLTSQIGGKLPTWNNFIAHPGYDSFWQKLAATKYLSQVTVPTMVVGGFWDQEDLYGPLATYQALEKHDKKNMVFLVEGPWNHGGWGGPGRSLSSVDFGSPTGKYFRKEIQSPFFCLLFEKQRKSQTGRSYGLSIGH